MCCGWFGAKVCESFDVVELPGGRAACVDDSERSQQFRAGGGFWRAVGFDCCVGNDRRATISTCRDLMNTLVRRGFAARCEAGLSPAVSFRKRFGAVPPAGPFA